MFDDYLARWGLTPDGEAIVTRNSRLLPVRRAGEPAMLKIAVEEEERSGSALMVWWNSDGAARVLAHDGDAATTKRAASSAPWRRGCTHGGIGCRPQRSCRCASGSRRSSPPRGMAAF